MRHFVLAAALLAAAPLHAQGFIGTYTLTGEVPLSADAASAALAGSFTPSAEPLAFHRNPALLAGVGRVGGGSATLGHSGDFGFPSDIDATHGALSAGTRWTVAGQPLAVGVGLSRTALDYGTQTWMDDAGNILGEFEAVESTWSAALGAGWSGTVEVDLGIGVHRRRSVPYLIGMGGESLRASGATVDLGSAITLPVFGRDARGPVFPILDLSTGYVQQHITLASSRPEAFGEQTAPSTSRRGVLGYGVRTGFDMPLGSGRVRPLVLDGRIEAAADLDRYQGFDFSPEGVPARTKLVRAPLVGALDAGNILLGDGGQSVVGRRAIRVTLFDALSYTRGHFEGDGFVDYGATWGLGLDVGGALRLAGLASGDAAMARVGQRLTMRASYGVTNVGQGFVRSTYGGLTLGWR